MIRMSKGHDNPAVEGVVEGRAEGETRMEAGGESANERVRAQAIEMSSQTQHEGIVHGFVTTSEG